MRACGLFGMIGVLWFGVTVLLMQAAAGDQLDWSRHYVSQFVHSSIGWLFPLGIAGHAAGNVALGLGLYRALHSGRRRLALIFFLSAATGLALTGLFSVEPPGESANFTGSIHRLAAYVSFISELLALVLFSEAFARDKFWRPVSPASFVLTGIAAASTAMLLIAILASWRQGFAERVALASFMAWEFWVGAQLTRRAGRKIRSV